MKILTNRDPRMFRVGDKYKGSTITDERPCPGRKYCEPTYQNFEVCEGFICKPVPPINFPYTYTTDCQDYFCLFRVSDNVKLLEERKIE
mgnify:CR=1 FL=1